MECPICNNDKNNSSYIVKEMQQGLREEFEYIECSKCGCLFIKNVPEDMGKYYDINYGSHVHKVTLKNRITDKKYLLWFLVTIGGFRVSLSVILSGARVPRGSVRGNVTFHPIRE